MQPGLVRFVVRKSGGNIVDWDGCYNDQEVVDLVSAMVHPRDSEDMLGHSDAMKVVTFMELNVKNVEEDSIK